MNHCCTLVNVEQKDQPLIYVNEQFTKITGYELSECVGKNCRFLQGELSSKDQVAHIKKSITNVESTFHDLINYRKDKTPFLNRLILFPIYLTDRSEIHFLGIQKDITEQVGFDFDKSHYKNPMTEQESKVINDKILNPLNLIFSYEQLNSMDLADQGSKTFDDAINNAYSQLAGVVDVFDSFFIKKAG